MSARFMLVYCALLYLVVAAVLTADVLLFARLP